MSDQPSVEDCKAHIRDIRNSHGADARNESEKFLRRGYESMLKLLSAQLYSEPSHFLFELIQNADDNNYAHDVQPEVMLAYRADGLLLFGCNELGFSKANVSAICDMNQSTKTLLKEGKKSCIGEKGIGFKSVFKVADKVWITSNNFSFLFDKNTPLGMVDPVWADFPSFPEQLRSNTMICLKIEKQEDRDVVREQLTKVLEPSSFMFLRRLSKIRIVRLEDSGDTFDEIVLSHNQRPFTHDLQLVTTTRSRGTKSKNSHYLVSDYTAREMPSTEQRQGVTESSIKLAFPIDEQQLPCIAKQEAYAFLPVCSSGLPFLIQADFVLVASRQGIDQSQPWNRRLQDHTVHALIQAFQRLKETHLKYLWPAYLPEAQVAHKFFDKLKDKFLERVKDIKILESRSGELAKPKVLMLVPDRYKDVDGTPLLTPANDRYLSNEYKPSDVSSLVTQSLDSKRFFDLLKTCVSKHEEYRTKPDSWHGRVSTVLLTEYKQLNMDELLILPIIPLDDGSWIPAKSRIKQSYSRTASRPSPSAIFYLPRPDSNIVIPKGVSLSIVEHNASCNEERRSFFRKIGAQDLDYEDVLKGIIKQHKEAIGNPDVELLLSHALYIFCLPSTSRLASNLSTTLWLADSRGEPFRGIELHMDNPERMPVSNVLSASGVAHFIHPKYLEVFPGNVEQQARWSAWLRECLGVHDAPRLTDKFNKALSKEFEWLVNNLPSTRWLACIRTNWDQYRLSEAPKLGDVRIPSEEVRNQIGSLVVDCTGGLRAKLKDTILPHLRSAVTTIQHMGFHFLDVKDGQLAEWLKFSTFGVATHRDLNFCLRILRKLPEMETKPDKMTVISVYRDIQHYCDSSILAKESTRAAFKNDPLVFLADSGTWVYLRTCVWDAPPCLQKVRPIAHIYATVQPFFKNTLGLQDADIRDFVDEIVALDNQVRSVSQIKELLLELSSRINPGLKYNLKALDNCRMFPIIDTQKRLVLLAGTDTQWFIPDGRNLSTCFKGMIPLLDFGQADQKKLEPLLGIMQIWNKHLSEKVTKQEVVQGREQAVKDEHHTRRFRIKSHYLLCLTKLSDRYKYKPLLENMEIWAVESIEVHRSLKVDNQEIRGRPLPAHIKIEKDQKIFVPISDLDENALDYYELSEKLFSLCKFEKSPKELIIGILSMPSIQQIENMLEEHGVIFDKLELDKLSNKYGNNSTRGMLASRQLAPQTNPEITTDDGSSSEDSDLSSLAALEDAPFRVTIKRKPKTVTVSRTHDRNWTHNPQSDQELGSGKADTEQLSGDGDWEVTSGSTSAGAGLPRTFTKSGNGSSSQMKSNKYSTQQVILDEEINDIGSERSVLDLDDNQPLRGPINRAQYDNPEFNMMDDPQAIRIGEQGEMKTYGFLKNLLGNYFTDDMWTSHTSEKYTEQTFDGDDSQFADFTIRDVSGGLTDWLVERDCEQAKEWMGRKGKDAVTYMVEVKATYGAHNEPFHMSQNQMDMAKQDRLVGDTTPSKVYMVMRVSNLSGAGGQAKVHPFVDPHGLMSKGELTCIAPGGYLVFSED